MGITVKNEVGQDVTNFVPREEPMVVYKCGGCRADVHGPGNLTHHQTEAGRCGPLNPQRPLNRGEAF